MASAPSCGLLFSAMWTDDVVEVFNEHGEESAGWPVAGGVRQSGGAEL
jgi:hypothetical protein